MSKFGYRDYYFLTNMPENYKVMLIEHCNQVADNAII